MTIRRKRVLVVDDSHFMRRALAKILEDDGRFEVVGQASDGVQAIELAARLQPDVVTMDYNMPIMNGVEATKRIMAARPIPIVMVSAHTTEGARQTLDALAAGAVDFIPKPSGEVSTDIGMVAEEIVAKVWEACSAAPRVPAPAAPRPGTPLRRPGRHRRIVIIGVSTGGPVALTRILPALPRRTRLALVVVQHMPATFTRALAERLDAVCSIRVREAEPGDRPVEGTALVAPGGQHLEFTPAGTVLIHGGPPVHGCRPSADVTMKSAAKVFGVNAVGVILTGMGRDGAEGMAAIKEAGGTTLAQDKETSLLFGMPKASIEMGVVDQVLPLDDLPQALLALEE